MTTEPTLALRAIEHAVAAHECRLAATAHPHARRGLTAAADDYSAKASELLGAICERAERIRSHLKAG